jgi:uncharacterized protein YggT (Ycf19 family)
MMKSYLLALSGTIISLVEFLISLRIVLKLLGARTSAPFVSWVYETTRPLLAPFEGMFPSSTLSTGFILEISALFALITYAFAGFLLESAIHQLSTTHK